MMLVELVLGMVMVKVMMDPSMVVSTLGHTMMLVLVGRQFWGILVTGCSSGSAPGARGDVGGCKR